MRRLSILAAMLLGLFALAPAAAQPTGYLPPNETGCSPTTSSAQCIPDTGKFYLMIENTSVSADVACRGGAQTAAINSSTSFMVYAGQRKSFSRATGPSPPTGPLHCISSSGTATLYIVFY